jgi:hypothetical protein
VFVGDDKRNTAKGCAASVDHIADTLFPKAEKTILVMDNLNSQGKAAL